METNALYLILNMASILPPLLLSFDRKVAYYRRWRYLFPAILIVAAVFIAWDVWFTAMGVWGFNARYLTGLHLGNLPLEECLFFITIPYSSVFIYDCFKAYFPGWKFPRMGIVLAWVLAAAMLVLGVLFIDRWYTGLTFLLLAALLVVQAVRKPDYLGWFFLSYGLVLIPFFIVNGILTGSAIEEQVVWYNDLENLGIRLVTIPVEDTFYGMLLILGIVSLYEAFQARAKSA